MSDLDIINKIYSQVSQGFWGKFDFWIGFVLSGAGLVFSILAFYEARKAKNAATEAGKTVKIQSIAIELSEISQRLDKIDTEIKFDEARDLLTEISKRLRRAIAFFSKEPDLEETISSLKEALSAARNSLNAVRPTDLSKEGEIPNLVYNAIEGYFAAINDIVADLIGLFEKKTMKIGDKDVD